MTNNPNDAPGLGGAGAELDLDAIKERLVLYERGVFRGSTFDDIAALVAEVERLRREVNTMAWSSYDQIIDKRWSWDREFEPPYPDVWDGK